MSHAQDIVVDGPLSMPALMVLIVNLIRSNYKHGGRESQ